MTEQFAVDPLTLWADELAPPEWEPVDRPPLLAHQVPPPGDWDLWIEMGGRGSGKTEGCARYFSRWMRMHPGHRGRIIAPSFGDAVESCIEGPSGLLSIDPEVRFVATAPGGAKVRWPNGSEAVVIGTWSPRDVERLRASGNRHLDWWEELAANPQFDPANAREGQTAWDLAEFGLRLGDRPHAIASTTPRSRPKLRALLAQPGTVTTHATIHDNPHLSERIKARLVERYQGTRIGRQELDGELLEEVEGALWNALMVSDAHDLCPHPLPELTRIVVAVDPATTSTATSDETGIVVAGRIAGTPDRAVLLADLSGRMSPDVWGKRTVRAFRDHHADRIVYEANQGGDMVALTIRAAAQSLGLPTPPMKPIHASHGKSARAEPVAALYEQCLVAGTSVETACGPVPIERVTTADFVWTRAGLRRVLWAGKTGHMQPTVTVKAGGRQIVCTPGHPVLTLARGFVRAIDLVPTSDRLLAWEPLPARIAVPRSRSLVHVAALARLASGGRPALASARASGSTVLATTSRWTATGAPLATPADNFCTAPSGRTPTVQCRMAGTFTTWTATRATTLSGTWSRSLRASTRPITGARWRTRFGPGCPRASGLGGLGSSRLSTPAISAAPPSAAEVFGFASARRCATRATGIESVAAGSPRADVYNLTVEGLPEFFAGGILVHNCRVWHAVPMPRLDDQLTGWVPGEGPSPDRLDAAVWALTELLLGADKSVSIGAYRR